MELQELPRHHPQDSPGKTLGSSAEEPIQDSGGEFREAKSTAEGPANVSHQRSASTRRFRSSCSNIVTTLRSAKHPVLRFLIPERPQKWWARNISLVVEHTSRGPRGGDPSDYLALERTFLSWIRTATALISFGVITTQFFVFKKVDVRKGSVLGAFTSAGGIFIVLIGCVRYFKQQRHLTRGNAISAGWEILVLLIILAAILLAVPRLRTALLRQDSKSGVYGATVCRSGQLSKTADALLEHWNSACNLALATLPINATSRHFAHRLLISPAKIGYTLTNSVIEGEASPMIGSQTARLTLRNVSQS